MNSKASITVLGSREEVERLWRDGHYRPEYIDSVDAAVRFVDAPGDHGTEIHVDLQQSPPGGKLGEAVQKLLGTAPRAKVKDDLRRFKQHVETGVIARSDATPEGEQLERKFKGRPAQPLTENELPEVGAR